MGMPVDWSIPALLSSMKRPAKAVVKRMPSFQVGHLPCSAVPQGRRATRWAAKGTSQAWLEICRPCR